MHQGVQPPGTGGGGDPGEREGEAQRGVVEAIGGNAHQLGDDRRFMQAMYPPIPFNQQGLVALEFLSVAKRKKLCLKDAFTILSIYQRGIWS
jgi:hypothetical protein